LGYRQAHQHLLDQGWSIAVLDRIVRERGSYPEFVRCDNGPEMTSNALRDWCRFSRTGAAFIEPGSP
jgi:putative transposase